MVQVELSQNDIEQIEHHGLDVELVKEQVRLFEKGAPYAKLARPCTAGDGIRQLQGDAPHRFVRLYEQAAGSRKLMKFVPASGAATRMFKSLLTVFNQHPEIKRQTIADTVAEEGDEYDDVLTFIDQIDRFAFYEALIKKMAEDCRDLEYYREHEDFARIIDYVLSEKGLNYAQKPKGQILFHRYADGARTAFEEHLVEAAEYVRDARGHCVLHLTVSPEHETGFHRLLEESAPAYEQAYSVRYDVTFSRQHPSTDTLAVDLENRPFRESDGSLLFRPGGHGSLIENLNALEGDIVFIKNVDNVVPDRLKSDTFLWKKALAGYLLDLEKKIRKHLDRLTGETPDADAIDAAVEFVETDLSVTLPERVKNAPAEERRTCLVDRLDRPLRVCGMVPSSGEPGGGPFWVKEDDGSVSIQIVESAQIDPDAPDQQEILKSLTHFNPVDIVCSLRNSRGEPYDLRHFVDKRAIFISKKSMDGKDLKALEHPGLWNGGMAWWNTVFVEVPLTTFNPVKAVNDLLRDAHQG